MNKKVLWITSTALMTALIIVMQAVTAPLGNTLITGSIVNCILVVSALFLSLPTGIAVACISPVCAKFFGIGSFWTLIPFIIAGNVTLVLIWNYIGGRNQIIALAAAAVAKFLVLYIGIVHVAVPFLLKLPPAQASKISATFSFPQLFTAAIGGAIAIIMIPVLKKVVRKTP